MQEFDRDNFRHEDHSRLWLRLLVPVLMILSCTLGQALAIPEENIITAHEGPHPVPIAPGILAGYLAVAVWPRAPRWSPELVALIGVLSTAGLYAVGLITYKYEGHVHQVDGALGFLLLYLAALMATYVTPPESIRAIPRKIVVPTLAVLLLLWSAAEQRGFAEEASRQQKFRSSVPDVIIDF